MKRRQLLRHLRVMAASFFEKAEITPGGTTRRRIAGLLSLAIPKSVTYWPTRSARIWVFRL